MRQISSRGATAKMKIKKSGELLAAAYCNIHGFWENAKPIKVK
jgi:superoxide reductase